MEELKYCDIVGYENYIVYENGQIFSKKRGIFLLPHVLRDGYHMVSLSRNNSVKRFVVHRLVAQHFIANPHNKPVVDHIDGIKDNNNANNLRWATVSENGLNSKKPRNNTTGEKNVYWNSKSNVWSVQFRVDGKNIYFGTFRDKNDAIEFARMKRQELYGEFAREG